jgi:hypothetical protein
VTRSRKIPFCSARGSVSRGDVPSPAAILCSEKICQRSGSPSTTAKRRAGSASPRITMLRGSMRSAALRPEARALRIRVRTSGSTVRRFPNASRYSVSKPQRAARSNTRSMVAALYDRPDLACGAKDFVWIDGPTTRTIRVCSAKNPRIAQYDFMFFGVTRPETRPGTKAGGSRFHQCPSAARAA